MNAEILCIGTEILLGDIVNTNGAYLARELAALGIDIFHQSVVGDNAQRLKDSLELALSRADMVITTGGLGPTYDDLTKKTVADYFGIGMETHAPSVKKIEALYKTLGREMTPNNLLQAEVPKGATVFFNDTGFAPGVAIEKAGKTVIMLPGPPNEMRPMFINKVVPYLQKKSGATIRSKTIHIFGMGESQVEDTLRDMMTSYQNPTIAPYAKQGEVQLRISAKAGTADAADTLIQPAIDQIKQRLGPVVYGVDIGSLQNAVVLALKQKNLTVATAESCTGGALSRAITDIPGSSAVFECGVCTYSNAMKQKLLNVSRKTLDQCGTVSAETAQEMAKGARAISGADIGIGVTGIAGPDGGSDEKPVGLVYMSIDSGFFCETKKFLLSRGHKNERDFIRNYATLHALSFILTAVNNKK
ncbi:MAG: competence/damage-inducible protein A [Eubacteriales bacterium]|nr:competence/damage-inducible protein A [Eubacteriales bacterium]